MPRHVVFQEPKVRPIDDARRGKQNSAVRLRETIVCQSPEFVAVASRCYTRMVTSFAGFLPSWVSLTQGLEDQCKGYRQDHARAGDSRWCYVTFVHTHTHRRVYAAMIGLAFGLAVLVVQVNRAPLLLTALIDAFLPSWPLTILMTTRMWSFVSSALSANR